VRFVTVPFPTPRTSAVERRANVHPDLEEDVVSVRPLDKMKAIDPLDAQSDACRYRIGWMAPHRASSQSPAALRRMLLENDETKIGVVRCRGHRPPHVIERLRFSF